MVRLAPAASSIRTTDGCSPLIAAVSAVRPALLASLTNSATRPFSVPLRSAEICEVSPAWQSSTRPLDGRRAAAVPAGRKRASPVRPLAIMSREFQLGGRLCVAGAAPLPTGLEPHECSRPYVVVPGLLEPQEGSRECDDLPALLEPHEGSRECDAGAGLEGSAGCMEESPGATVLREKVFGRNCGLSKTRRVA
eukprot:5190505-Prymnesium_polylepis.2